MVGPEIMPRSATTQTRPIWKRWRRRSTMGISTATSAVFPGAISVQIGRPSPSTTKATIICLRSGRWSLEWPRRPRLAPPAPVKLRLEVSMNTTERSVNRFRRRAKSSSSTLSLMQRGANGVAPACSPSGSSSPSQAMAR